VATEFQLEPISLVDARLKFGDFTVQTIKKMVQAVREFRPVGSPDTRVARKVRDIEDRPSIEIGILQPRLGESQPSHNG
jgi:hypothetical protein